MLWETILIAAYIALIAEGILIIFLLRSWKAERMELVKMIAAKSYPEYAVLERKDKPPPGDHKNMVSAQQNKIFEQQKEFFTKK